MFWLKWSLLFAQFRSSTCASVLVLMQRRFLLFAPYNFILLFGALVKFVFFTSPQVALHGDQLLQTPSKNAKILMIVSIATDVCDSVSPVSLIPVVSVSFVADDESGSVVPVVFTLIAFLELFFPLKEMVFTDSCFSFSICSL